MTNLVIGSVEYPIETLYEFDQSYRKLNAANFRRTADGSGVLRSTWSGKIATSIRGKGWAPGAFDAIALDTTHTIKCAAPLPVTSATTTVTIPASRRTDADNQPIGFAEVGGLLVYTTITNIADINAKSTNDALLAAVSGATGYRVHYTPEFTGVIRALSVTGQSTANYEIEIEAEEV